ARLAGKRVLFWTHGWTHPDSPLAAALKRAFFGLAHGLLLYGHGAKVIGLASGFDAERLHVIYNSLDYAAQRAAREAITAEDVRRTRTELFGDPDVPVVVCPTRLVPVRRLDQLLDALALLRRRGRTVNALLIGDGPQREELERQAAANELPVHFYGACYDERELGRLIMAGTVTVAPGRVGLTAIHSMAFGVPVITHDDPARQMPEFEAIVPGRTGDLFPPGDVEALADRLDRWTVKPAVTADVRAACIDIVERFYNPTFQRRAIDRAVAGRPADDLFWMKPRAGGD
ncbi:MAG: glycosyltransferase, partial [Planctomycetota bacterium]